MPILDDVQTWVMVCPTISGVGIGPLIVSGVIAIQENHFGSASYRIAQVLPVPPHGTHLYTLKYHIGPHHHQTHKVDIDLGILLLKHLTIAMSHMGVEFEYFGDGGRFMIPVSCHGPINGIIDTGRPFNSDEEGGDRSQKRTGLELMSEGLSGRSTMYVCGIPFFMIESEMTQASFISEYIVEFPNRSMIRVDFGKEVLIHEAAQAVLILTAQAMIHELGYVGAAYGSSVCGLAASAVVRPSNQRYHERGHFSYIYTQTNLYENSVLVQNGHSYRFGGDNGFMMELPKIDRWDDALHNPYGRMNVDMGNGVRVEVAAEAARDMFAQFEGEVNNPMTRARMADALRARMEQQIRNGTGDHTIRPMSPINAAGFTNTIHWSSRVRGSGTMPDQLIDPAPTPVFQPDGEDDAEH